MIKRLLPVVLLILTVVVMLPVLNGPFLGWDDPAYVFKNPLAQNFSLESLFWVFLNYFEGLYQPLVLVSLGIDYQLFGNQPMGYHIVNLGIHLINVMLLFFFVRKISNNYFLALFTAALFALHPVQVETVAWISQRKNLVFTLFFLLSLIHYHAYLLKGNIHYFILALTWFILSLFSKPVAVTLVLILPLMDFLVKDNPASRKRMLEKIPFVLLGIFFASLALLTFGNQQTAGNLEYFRDNYSFIERLLFVFHGFNLYVFKLIIPVKLSAFYPYPAPGENLSVLLYVSPVITILILTISFYLLKKNRLMLFGFLFFLLNMIPALQIIPNTSTIISERYLYLPSAGFFLIVSYLVTVAIRQKSQLKVGFAVLVLLLLSVKTYSRGLVWVNEYRFFSDITEKYPNDITGWFNRANTFREMGNPEAAMEDYNKALQIDSLDYRSLTNRGSVKLGLKDYQGAINDFGLALSIKKDNGMLYFNRAKAREALGDFENAVRDYNKAIRHKYAGSYVYSGRGTALFALGKNEEAIADYNKAISLDRNNIKAHYNMALVKLHMGQNSGAISDLNKTIELNPGFSNAFHNRAIAAFRLGQIEQAFKDYNRALELDPNNFDAYLNRGINHFEMKNYEAAFSDLNKAIDLQKRLAPAYLYRGLTIIQSEKLEGNPCSDFNLARIYGLAEAESAIQEYCK